MRPLGQWIAVPQECFVCSCAIGHLTSKSSKISRRMDVDLESLVFSCPVTTSLCILHSERFRLRLIATLGQKDARVLTEVTEVLHSVHSVDGVDFFDFFQNKHLWATNLWAAWTCHHESESGPQKGKMQHENGVEKPQKSEEKSTKRRDFKHMRAKGLWICWKRGCWLNQIDARDIDLQSDVTRRIPLSKCPSTLKVCGRQHMFSSSSTSVMKGGYLCAVLSEL